MCSGMNYTAIIKNKSNKDLINIQLIWIERPNFPVTVENIKKGDFKRTSLPNLVYGTAPLKMYYTDEFGSTREYPILDELTGFQERVICITIKEIDEKGELKYEVDPKYEPAL